MVIPHVRARLGEENPDSRPLPLAKCRRWKCRGGEAVTLKTVHFTAQLLCLRSGSSVIGLSGPSAEALESPGESAGMPDVLQLGRQSVVAKADQRFRAPNFSHCSADADDEGLLRMWIRSTDAQTAPFHAKRQSDHAVLDGGAWTVRSRLCQWRQSRCAAGFEKVVGYHPLASE